MKNILLNSLLNKQNGYFGTVKKMSAKVCGKMPIPGLYKCKWAVCAEWAVYFAC